MMNRGSIDAQRKRFYTDREISGQGAVLFPKGKFMKAIFSPKKRSGLRTKPLPKKSRRCLRKPLTAM